jgi:cellobiose-specific phosphotransferase system component IIB
MVAAGMTTWLLVNGDETKVEDDDKEEEAEAAAEAQRDAQLRAAEVRVKVAVEAEPVAMAEAERVAEAEAEEQATHWATEMDKALTYRRDVDQSTTARREAARRAETEHRIEHCQEAAICATMAAIEAVGVGSNGDGGALQ